MALIPAFQTDEELIVQLSTAHPSTVLILISIGLDVVIKAVQEFNLEEK